MKTDIQLTKDVLAELEWEPSVSTWSIGVEVKDVIVTLAGHLDSHPEKISAEYATQRVVGMKGLNR